MLKKIFAKIADFKLQKFFISKKSNQLLQINDIDQIADPDSLPAELQYVIKIRPSRHSKVMQLIKDGHSLKILPRKTIPPEILISIQRIALTQENTLLPWLEHLFSRGAKPRWQKVDQEDADARGYSLDEEISIIQKHQKGIEFFALTSQQSKSVPPEYVHLVKSLNEDLAKLHAPHLAHEIALLNSFNTQNSSRYIVLALIIAVPCAYILESILPGLGKSLIPLAFGSFSEIKKHLQKYQLGYSFWQLKTDIIKKIPAYLFVLLCSAMIQPLYSSGSYFASSVCFAIALLFLPAITQIQNSLLSKSEFHRLISLGKVEPTLAGAWRFSQAGKAWWITYAAYTLSPLLIVIVFILAPHLVASGLIITLLSAAPQILLLGLFSLKKQTQTFFFKKQIKRFLSQIIVLSS